MKALGIIAAVYASGMLASALFAAAFGSPFTLWFGDTEILLVAMLGVLLTLGIVWDGTLVSIGLASEALPQGLTGGRFRPTVESLRSARFFTCGPLPIAMMALTALAILGTSNITLLNMELLRETTHWRDAFFWRLEAPLLTRLQYMAIDAAAWDRLYHSAWGIEMLAAFALVVVGRGPRIVLHFCVSMILLFYIGRLLGVLNPVMGPAFYQPELFRHLDGSATSTAMKMVADVLAQTPEQAMSRGGILLGGVSAMPSLHVAMVATTAFWLAVADRRTMFVTVPWVLAVWASTVVLGWHYILDGAAGIVLAAASIWITRVVLQHFGMAEPQAASSSRTDDSRMAPSADGRVG